MKARTMDGLLTVKVTTTGEGLARQHPPAVDGVNTAQERAPSSPILFVGIFEDIYQHVTTVTDHVPPAPSVAPYAALTKVWWSLQFLCRRRAVITVIIARRRHFEDNRLFSRPGRTITTFASGSNWDLPSRSDTTTDRATAVDAASGHQNREALSRAARDEASAWSVARNCRGGAAGTLSLLAGRRDCRRRRSSATVITYDPPAATSDNIRIRLLAAHPLTTAYLLDARPPPQQRNINFNHQFDGRFSPTARNGRRGEAASHDGYIRLT
ncbi:hypothetical protein HPP92_026060 [Vanilla planifolia]|uniref:Uncharacterized protein n=1 Tax=Vanilla planifolia TaxID=51239 RepID=A0A835PHM6_VANPL|nr:hypothetical protein HPP92_026331 [Vanilla planifolia]KAG0451802.1 hypothetical protein HPP92_026060 [Vanilla planifolia]